MAAIREGLPDIGLLLVIRVEVDSYGCRMAGMWLPKGTECHCIVGLFQLLCSVCRVVHCGKAVGDRRMMCVCVEVEHECGGHSILIANSSRF